LGGQSCLGEMQEEYTVKNTFLDEKKDVYTAISRPKLNRSHSCDSILNKADDSTLNRAVVFPAWKLVSLQDSCGKVCEESHDGHDFVHADEPSDPATDVPTEDDDADDSVTSDSSKIEIPRTGTSVSMPVTGCVICELCKEPVAKHEPAVMMLPLEKGGGKKVYEDTKLDTREAKHCHEKCLNSCKPQPCIDWQNKGKCRFGFSCGYCHLRGRER